MKRARLAIYIVILAAFAMPTALANDCDPPFPKLFQWTYTYYSGYYTGTVNGQMWDVSCCSWETDSWGTLDGETMIADRWSCNAPYEQAPSFCYEKINGTLTKVDCP